MDGRHRMTVLRTVLICGRRMPGAARQRSGRDIPPAGIKSADNHDGHDGDGRCAGLPPLPTARGIIDETAWVRSWPVNLTSALALAASPEGRARTATACHRGRP